MEEKEKEITNKKETTDKKETTNLGYQGNVTLKITKGQKVLKSMKIHNAGTLQLFHVLASSLCGNDERANMPRYMDALKRSGEDYQSILSVKAAITSRRLEPLYDGSTTVGWKATFTSIIPQNTFKETSSISRLALYNSQSSSTDLAYIDISSAIDLDESQNLIVEWSMSISNVASSN